MPDLSIIIPIYNTDIAALECCFSSVSSVSGLEYDVLLIDDGSGMETAQFCRQYAEANPRFCYLRKKNGGVSSARNFGLDHATGRYVMFADADDMLLGAPITKACIANDPDLVIFDMLLWENGKESLWASLPNQGGNVDREDFFYRLTTGKSLNSPCVKLFKSSLLQQHGLRFREAFITGEDWLFVCDFALQTATICYVPAPCYRYYRDSATGQSRAARFPDKILDNQLCRFQRKLEVIHEEIWQKHNKAQVLSFAAAELIENLFNTAADMLLAKVYTTPRRQQLRAAVCQAGQLLCRPVSPKTRLKLSVLAHFPIALAPLAKMRAIYLKNTE